MNRNTHQRSLPFSLGEYIPLLSFNQDPLPDFGVIAFGDSEDLDWMKEDKELKGSRPKGCLPFARTNVGKLIPWGLTCTEYSVLLPLIPFVNSARWTI